MQQPKQPSDPLPAAWSTRAKFGAVLVALSVVPWILALVAPFFTDASFGWIATAIVAGEVIQLAGLALAGPDMWTRLKRAFRGWRAKGSNANKDA